jgi:hypothetical protein
MPRSNYFRVGVGVGARARVCGCVCVCDSCVYYVAVRTTTSTPDVSGHVLTGEPPVCVVVALQTPHKHHLAQMPPVSPSCRRSMTDHTQWAEEVKRMRRFPPVVLVTVMP